MPGADLFLFLEIEDSLEMSKEDCLRLEDDGIEADWESNGVAEIAEDDDSPGVANGLAEIAEDDDGPAVANGVTEIAEDDDGPTVADTGSCVPWWAFVPLDFASTKSSMALACTQPLQANWAKSLLLYNNIRVIVDSLDMLTYVDQVSPCRFHLLRRLLCHIHSFDIVPYKTRFWS